MKKINRITTYMVVAIAMTTVISCGENSNWTPGPQPAENNPGVYFDKSIPSVVEVEADNKGILHNKDIMIPMGRDESKSGTALQVPIKIRYAESNLTIAETVTFKAGSSTAELKISIDEFEFKKQYPFSVEIDENYSNPNKVYGKNEYGGSTRIESKIEVVCLFAIATFTPVDYSSTTPPKFIPFEQRIYDNHDSTYTFKNFLYNNAGYNFSFRIDKDKNIRPLETNGYHAKEDERWYFYSENKDETTSRIPCYIPGTKPNDFITYIYFYTPEYTSRYTAFWMDLSSKTGRMMGYARYSISTMGRIAFNFSWE